MFTPRIFFAAVGSPGTYVQHNPPIGLLYIAGWLRSKMTVDMRVVSQRTEGLDTKMLVKQMEEYSPDIIGLSSVTPSAHMLPEIVQGIRKVLPKALVVLGGPHVSALRSQVLEDTKADLAVLGEGERTMEMILEAWKSGSSMRGIPGIIQRTEGGDIVTNPGETLVVDDLDTLPFPAVDLIDLKKYWPLNSHTLLPYPHKYAMMFSSRGCPYGCYYCANIYGRRYRSHSAARIVEETQFYVRNYGIDEIEFYDDCFNLDRKRVEDFCDLLLRTNGPIKMVFANGLRADILDEPTVDSLVASGLYCCHFALETGSPRLQKFIDKNLDIEKFLEAVEWTTKRRVFTNGFVMLGFPTETAQEMEQTIQTAANSGLHTAEFFTVTPWPNTPLTNYVQEHTPEKLNNLSFENQEYWRMRVNLSAESDQTLFSYQGKAYRKFYLNPNRLFRIFRDYPKPMYLPTRLPAIVRRMGKR